MRKNNSNSIIISGTGKKVGKTTFAEKTIKYFASENNVVAIKTSPHFHDLTGEYKMIYECENYVIIQETSKKAINDSTRMLKAGASKSYYIQAKDEHIDSALKIIQNQIVLTDVLLVIESGSIFNNVNIPGIRVYINACDERKQNQDFNIMNKANLIIKSSEIANFKPYMQIKVSNNLWQLV